MKKINCDKACGGQTFKKALGITALALLLLMSIAGASPLAYIKVCMGQVYLVLAGVSVVLEPFSCQDIS